ncbi:MAG: VWA domain-containing protein [Anaerolineales bacterium]|nr:VWA domain-containing protein [Anaerolineales bacterium]
MKVSRNTMSRWQVCLFAIALAFGALPVHGQGIVPPFPPPRPLPIPPAPMPVPAPPTTWVVVEKHAVAATIDGPVAEVRVEQVLRNDGLRPAEGVYLFPLPKDAAVSDFQMTVDGKTMEGKLLDSEEARRIYEEIVRRQLDPALLEYVGRGVFQANVFPIPPGESREISFTYTQVLDQQNGLYRFNYPLPTRQLSSLPVESVNVVVNLTNEPGLRTLYSPAYPIQIERDQDDAATVTYAATAAEPQNDFDLYFGVDDQAIGLNLLSYKPAGEEGYFLLLASPSIDAAVEDIVARDIVLVVDVSGSMRGDKIKQARDAAHFVVDHLNPEDRFNLISFSTGATLWARELQPVTNDSLKFANQWIDRLRDGGSTDINRALLEALAQVGEDGRPAYILFLTDGQPTQGEVNPDQIVANAANNRPADGAVRLFTFGIGYDVNTDLLDILSQDLGGRASYVAPEEKIDEAVSAFYTQVSTPVLTGVSLAFGDDVLVEDLYPYPLPDLFAGEQLVVAGRYRDGGPAEVTLTGAVNGRESTFVYSDRELVTAVANRWWRGFGPHARSANSWSRCGAPAPTRK